MRIPTLSSLLVIVALAAPARADRKELIKPTVGTHAATRGDRGGASLTTGDLRLTGTTRESRPSGQPPAPRRDPFLSAAEVATEVRPYAPEIERCYLDHLDDARRAGHLDLTFVIGRDGYVVSLAAAAPGLPTRTAHKVEDCIREAAVALHFPPRRNDTTAIVPYYFQHTDAPGAGPQLSCWNPRGC